MLPRALPPLFIFCLAGLSSAMANRAMDPLVTAVARDFDVAVAAAALVVSVYALPYAFGQPLLGPVADYYGKARILRACLWLQCLSLVAVVLSPTLAILMVARFIGGVAGGGIMPIAMASVGDRYPPAQRQQAIATYVSVSLVGFIFSSAAAGILAVYISWRAIFVITLIAAILAALAMRTMAREAPTPAQPMRFKDVVAVYPVLFSNPRAVICYVAVLLEGMALYGTTPYIAPLLETRGEGGPGEAGLIITGLGVGALVFTSTVKYWLRAMSRYKLMFFGGFFTAAGPFMFAFDLSWHWAALFFGLSGLGFMMVHNSIQTEVAALAPSLRGSAFALHSASFFVGQSLGPILFALGLGVWGATATLMTFAAVLLVIGPVISVLFSRMTVQEEA